MKLRALGTMTLLVGAALGATACGPEGTPRATRGTSEGMRFSIAADSLPPHAMDRINWRITVTDAKTGQPIEGGQGRVYGRRVVLDEPNKSQPAYGEGLEPAPELGTYVGQVTYMTAGAWQMTVEFRRDSLSPFGRVDWLQDVKVPKPLGGG